MEPKWIQNVKGAEPGNQEIDCLEFKEFFEVGLVATILIILRNSRKE